MAERDEQFSELPSGNPGARLRRARESAGMSRGDIAALTKIAERHLASIEADNFGALASRAYAVGFSRNYARAVGLDESEIAQSVRDELDGIDAASRGEQPSTFEPGDPARVPTSRTAWVAAIGALAVIAVFGFVWRNYYAPAVSLPNLVQDKPIAAAPPAPAPATLAPASQGPVVLTALDQAVWVKVYDSAGQQLMQKEMALGESYTLPADANGPMIATARPDALQISVGGQVVPKLSDASTAVKDVPIDAAALLARAAPAPQSGAALPAGAASLAPPKPAAPRAAPRQSPSPAGKPVAAESPAPVAAAERPAAAPAAGGEPIALVVPPPQSSTVSQ
jgi:cytoskeleton protein RodZ